MTKQYYISFEDKKLGKRLFLGSIETAWYSDFQSARAFSKPELKRSFSAIKRQYKDKKLRIIKINIKEEAL